MAGPGTLQTKLLQRGDAVGQAARAVPQQIHVGVEVVAGMRVISAGGEMPQMKPSPSGLIHIPEVSNTSGMPALSSGARIMNTVRLRGSTGSGIPASAATRPETGRRQSRLVRRDPFAACGAYRVGVPAADLDRYSFIVHIAGTARDRIRRAPRATGCRHRTSLRCFRPRLHTRSAVFNQGKRDAI